MDARSGQGPEQGRVNRLGPGGHPVQIARLPPSARGSGWLERLARATEMANSGRSPGSHSFAHAPGSASAWPPPPTVISSLDPSRRQRRPIPSGWAYRR